MSLGLGIKIKTVRPSGTFSGDFDGNFGQ